MQRTIEEEQNISKTKYGIELIFGKIIADAEQCNLFGMANGMTRIVDGRREGTCCGTFLLVDATGQNARRKDD